MIFDLTGYKVELHDGAKDKSLLFYYDKERPLFYLFGFFGLNLFVDLDIHYRTDSNMYYTYKQLVTKESKFKYSSTVEYLLILDKSLSNYKSLTSESLISEYTKPLVEQIIEQYIFIMDEE